MHSFDAVAHDWLLYSALVQTKVARLIFFLFLRAPGAAPTLSMVNTMLASLAAIITSEYRPPTEGSLNGDGNLTMSYHSRIYERAFLDDPRPTQGILDDLLPKIYLGAVITHPTTTLWSYFHGILSFRLDSRDVAALNRITIISLCNCRNTHWCSFFVHLSMRQKIHIHSTQLVFCS